MVSREDAIIWANSLSSGTLSAYALNFLEQLNLADEYNREIVKKGEFIDSLRMRLINYFSSDEMKGINYKYEMDFWNDFVQNKRDEFLHAVDLTKIHYLSGKKELTKDDIINLAIPEAIEHDNDFIDNVVKKANQLYRRQKSNLLAGLVFLRNADVIREIVYNKDSEHTQHRDFVWGLANAFYPKTQVLDVNVKYNDQYETGLALGNDALNDKDIRYEIIRNIKDADTLAEQWIEKASDNTCNKTQMPSMML